MCRRICSLKGYKKNKQLRKVLTYDNEVLIAQFPKLFIDFKDLDCYNKKNIRETMQDLILTKMTFYVNKIYSHVQK